jgi:pimeloyl-ACP methyl ester carboxylesterase
MSTTSALYDSPDGARSVEDHYRWLLARWPVPSQQRTVPTREGDTFVVSCGPEDGPNVIALQGSGANAAMWSTQVGTWSQHLRVHAVDVIGEPGLSAPTRAPLNSARHAAWLDDVLDALDISSAALIGVSLGGWFALDYAIRSPARVNRLVLLNPSGVGRRRLRVLFAAVALKPFGAWGMRRTLEFALGTDAAFAGADLETQDRSGASVEGEVGNLALTIFKHYRPRLEAPPIFDDAALSGISVPVLAVLGGRDAMIDANETNRRLAATLTKGDVHLLSGAGHMLPDQTASVLNFLLSKSDALRGPDAR